MMKFASIKRDTTAMCASWAKAINPRGIKRTGQLAVAGHDKLPGRAANPWSTVQFATVGSDRTIAVGTLRSNVHGISRRFAAAATGTSIRETKRELTTFVTDTSAVSIPLIRL